MQAASRLPAYTLVAFLHTASSAGDAVLGIGPFLDDRRVGIVGEGLGVDPPSSCRQTLISE